MAEAHSHAGHSHAGHSHAGHSHAGHSHDHRSLGRSRLLIVLGLTAAFMLVELVGGLMSNSLALLADAGHMLSDVAALALSIFALWFSRRPATEQKSYGYHRFEILAAFINGMTLVVIALLILWQAYHRVMNPQPVEGKLMLGIAGVGLAINIAAAFLLHSSAGHSLNVRGAYLHVLSDMLGSVGAMAAAIVILMTCWTPADPIISTRACTSSSVSITLRSRSSIRHCIQSAGREGNSNGSPHRRALRCARTAVGHHRASRARRRAKRR
jgi:cobalt-zinc-cadmium efflux system protein